MTEPAGNVENVHAHRNARGIRWSLFFLVRLPQAAMAMVLTLLIVFLVVSVISRYFMDIGMPWADEFARILFAWIVMVGFALAVQQRANVGVDWMVLHLPLRLKKAVYVLQDIIVLVFSVVFTYAAWQSFKFASMQILPALDVTIGWLYGSAVVAGGMMVIYAMFNLLQSVRGTRQDAHFETPGLPGSN